MSRLMIPLSMGWVVPLYHMDLLLLLPFPPLAISRVTYLMNCWYYKKSTHLLAHYIVCRSLYLQPPTSHQVSFYCFNLLFSVFVLVACFVVFSDRFFSQLFQRIWLAKVVVVMFTEDVFQMARNWRWKFWSHLKTW